MNKVYVIVAVVAVVLVGGYVLMKGQNSSMMKDNSQVSQPTQAQSQVQEIVSPTGGAMMEQNVVKYTDNGFSPNSLTVKVGTEVTFTNDSSNPMWVASNPHPVHTDLPGFDQLKGVDKGGSYKYTFQKVGSWKFHNHLNAGVGGVVVVTE